MKSKKMLSKVHISQIRPLKTNETRRAYGAVIGAAPPASLELRMYHGNGTEITDEEIEARMHYLRGEGKRSVKASYRAIALMFLQEELERRRLALTIG